MIVALLQIAIIQVLFTYRRWYLNDMNSWELIYEILIMESSHRTVSDHE